MVMNSLVGPRLVESRLQGLYDLARRLLATEAGDASLEQVATSALELLMGDNALLAVREGSDLSYRVLRNWQPDDLESRRGRLSTTIVEAALERGDTMLVRDAAVDERFQEAPSVLSLGIRSVLVAPLRTSAGSHGALYVERSGKTEPFDDDDLAVFEQIVELADGLLSSQIDQAHSAPLPSLPWSGEPTRDPAWRRDLEVLARVAVTDLPVLIEGPTGAGKELVARSLHAASARASGPFVALNCGELSEGLFEAELFGHRRGAYTGASRGRAGILMTADAGTLFLDEVGELPLSLQPKLLRVLQEGEVRPVGSDATVALDVRFVTATNRDLVAEVEAGRFREDLYFRLNAVKSRVPPLSDRRVDVLPLVRFFLVGGGAGHRRLTRALEERLVTFAWPGNVRQLENEVARMLAVAAPEEALDVVHLSEEVQRGDPRAALPDPEEVERQLVEAHLLMSGGNKSQAARTLGITREGLRKRMLRLGM